MPNEATMAARRSVVRVDDAYGRFGHALEAALDNPGTGGAVTARDAELLAVLATGFIDAANVLLEASEVAGAGGPWPDAGHFDQEIRPAVVQCMQTVMQRAGSGAGLMRLERSFIACGKLEGELEIIMLSLAPVIRAIRSAET